MEGHAPVGRVRTPARRALAGAALAGAVAAGGATGQVWLARWWRVLVPDQD